MAPAAAVASALGARAAVMEARARRRPARARGAAHAGMSRAESTARRSWCGVKNVGFFRRKQMRRR